MLYHPITPKHTCFLEWPDVDSCSPAVALFELAGLCSAHTIRITTIRTQKRRATWSHHSRLYIPVPGERKKKKNLLLADATRLDFNPCKKTRVKSPGKFEILSSVYGDWERKAPSHSPRKWHDILLQSRNATGKYLSFRTKVARTDGVKMQQVSMKFLFLPPPLKKLK